MYINTACYQYAIILGHVASLLDFPPLLGMFCAGLLLRNVPRINVAKNLSLEISSPLRCLQIKIINFCGEIY